MTLSWHWVAESAGGPAPRQVEELAQHFPTQGEAESWLGEAYPDLQAAGVHAVSLYEEERLVYGPMSLDP